MEHPYDVKVSLTRCSAESLHEPCVASIVTHEETQTRWSRSHLQALVFEKPGFTGECAEVCGDLLTLCEEPDEDNLETVEQKKKSLSTVGSVKIVGGL